MVTKNFDQAGALIKRMMEGVGGSADAYADLPAQKAPTPPPVEEEEETLVLPGENLPVGEDEVCVDGTIDWTSLGDRVWTSPPPISEEYQSNGVVEDSEELREIYRGFERARRTNQPQAVRLETGIYQIQRPWKLEKNWQLHDTVKDRLYLLEDEAYDHFDVVNEEDLFIWVTQGSNRDVDLGYILMGYVFLRK